MGLFSQPRDFRNRPRQGVWGRKGRCRGHLEGAAPPPPPPPPCGPGPFPTSGPGGRSQRGRQGAVHLAFCERPARPYAARGKEHQAAPPSASKNSSASNPARSRCSRHGREPKGPDWVDERGSCSGNGEEEEGEARGLPGPASAFPPGGGGGLCKQPFPLLCVRLGDKLAPCASPSPRARPQHTHSASERAGGGALAVSPGDHLGPNPRGLLEVGTRTPGGTPAALLRPEAVSRCGTRSPPPRAPRRRSDPPSPHGSRTLGRARVHPPRSPASPAMAGWWDPGPQRRSAPRRRRDALHPSLHPPGRRAARGMEQPAPAQPQPPSQVEPRCLPQGHAQTHSRGERRSSKLRRGPDSERSRGPCARRPPPLRPPGSGPCPRGSHTPATRANIP
ncbi:basic proline-rich protein-like [Vulpes lagopus]|uniref:basic proline-rich protein-like n=1 Tax=Vulpes lagopus TaxID=494514 RepID=UPI001BC990A2|nr:basic proline-rich protein-like [Vulpes lagopus]